MFAVKMYIRNEKCMSAVKKLHVRSNCNLLARGTRQRCAADGGGRTLSKSSSVVSPLYKYGGRTSLLPDSTLRFILSYAKKYNLINFPSRNPHVHVSFSLKC